MLSSPALLATATGPYVYWIASRAAGTAALILASLSVSVGLLMGGKLLKGRALEGRVLHESLALATLATLIVHGLSLLGDPYLHPSLADVSIPFVSGYETLWTSAGIVAFWALLVLGVSYYARARIGVGRWRVLHRFTALAWALGLVHALGEGTDSGQLWFLAMVGAVAVPALCLLLVRIGAARLRRGRAARASRTATDERRASRTASHSAAALRTASSARPLRSSQITTT